jgi:hypothetical protein
MVDDRKSGLKANFRLMFWIQALTEIKVINVISTIFYVHRGMTLSQIFIMAIVFATVSIITEVPSSYLADKWSRKGLVVVALLIGVVYWTFSLFAYGMIAFLVANSLYALAYSIMSGTDEALVYDSAKELGEETDSLKKLGLFYSGQRIFKIVTPIIAVLIARNLSDSQFVAIIMIDVVANLVALVLADKLVEPNHFVCVEKTESGVMMGAIGLLRHNRPLLKLIINRTMFFIASFSVWRISSEYFNGLRIPIIIIGLTTASYQLATFVFNIYSHKWFKNISSKKIIDKLNFVNVVAVTGLIVNQLSICNQAVALVCFWVISTSEVFRWPYFSDLFNKVSHSYNRATTLSLANLLNSVFQIPVFILGAILISLNYTYLFAMVWIIVVGTYWFFGVDNSI